ncbi:regulator of Ty1 Transposition [Massospora cicadina]|nr:regulator of Ty1 Transposition [Massospora cicadina]
MGKDMFNGIRAWINSNLDVQVVAKVKRILEGNGAEVTDRIEDVTHFITADWQIPGIGVGKVPQPCATPRWVLNAYRYRKRFDPKFYSPDPDKIFSGLIVATSQLPIGDTERIFGAVSALGGQWTRVLVPEVTHLITSTPDGPKYLKATSQGSRTLVGPYRYPDPPILDPAFDPARPHFYELGGEGSFADETFGKADVGAQGFLKAQVFYFDEALGLPEEAFENLTSQLLTNGATLLPEFDASKVTCYICQTRDSRFYEEAIEHDVYTGTLTWLYHILINSRLDPPTQQLLFYPTPPQPVAGVQTFVSSGFKGRVTVTNFSSGSRHYLQRLLEAMGATYTPYLAIDNTHLICARPDGPKYEMAQARNIIVVNHLWVEDCFRAWECQAVTRLRYTHFPLGACLDSLVGLAPYLPTDFYPDPVAEEATMERINASQVLKSEASDLSSNNPAQPRALRKAANSATQALGKLMEALNQYEQATKNKRNRLASPLDDGLEVEPQKPEPKRPIPQTGAPPQRSHEQQRAEPTLTPRRSRRLEQLNPPKTPRGKPQARHRATGSEDVCKERPKATGTADVRILFTGHKPHPNERKSISLLGGRIVTSTEECTHLIAQTASRTAKFICAISRAKLIVTPTWLDKSIKEGMFLDEAPFMLLDKRNEKLFGFTLSESIRTAKAKRLLSGYEFAITPSVFPDLDTLALIIRAGGGMVITPFPPKRLFAPNAKSLVGSEAKLILLSCEKDLDFLKARLPPAFSCSPEAFSIYRPELVLSGSLRQELKFADNRLVFKPA